MTAAGAAGSGRAFVDGAPIPVDVAAVERELAALWKAAVGSQAESGAPAVMHACLLNLVVCCRGEEEASRAGPVLVEVTRARPSRILVCVADPAAPGRDLRASISARCAYAPGGARQVCCEQVVLTAGPAAEARLPGALLPLLVHDLPVVAWWPGIADLASPLAGRLLAEADLLLVDSRRFPDTASALRRLAEAPCPVTDLAWMGMRGWREMTAGMFDGVATESYPGRLERIVVEHAPGGARGSGPCSEALLLGSWAASRLGWRPAASPGAQRAPTAGAAVALPARVVAAAVTSTGGDTAAGAGRERHFLLARPSGGAAELILRETSEALPAAPPGGVAGRLDGIALEAPGAVFEVRRPDSPDCLTASVTMEESCPLPRTTWAAERDEATLIGRGIEEMGRDAVFQRTLDLAVALLDGAAGVRRP